MTTAAWIELLIRDGGTPGVETERRSRKVCGERLESVKTVPAIRMPGWSYYRLGSETAVRYAEHVYSTGR